MDGGGYYNRGNPGVQFGGTSNYYNGIPDQLGTSHGVPSQALGYVGINQKLDRLIGLVENQQKETESIKSNVEKFREELDELKSSVSVASTQSTPISKRVPSKLSVRHAMCYNAIHFKVICCGGCT